MHRIFFSLLLFFTATSALLEAKLIPVFKSDFALFFPHVVFAEPDTLRDDTRSPFIDILKPDNVDERFDTVLEDFTAIGQVSLDGGLFWQGNDNLFRHTIATKIKFMFDQEMVPGYRQCIFCSSYKRYKVSSQREASLIINERNAQVDKSILSTRLDKLQLSTEIDLRYAYRVNAGLVLWSSLHFMSLLPTDVLKIDPLNNRMKTERFASSFSVSLSPAQLGITAESFQAEKTDESRVSQPPDGFELIFGLLYGYWLRENYAFQTAHQLWGMGEIDGRQASSTFDKDFSTMGSFHELTPTLRLLHRTKKNNYAFLNGIDFSHRLELYPQAAIFEESNGDLSFEIGDVVVNRSALVLSSSISHKSKSTRAKPKPVEITFTAAYKLAVNYKNTDFWISEIPSSDYTIRIPIYESNYIVMADASRSEYYTLGAAQTELRHSIWLELSLLFNEKVDWRNQISMALQTFPMNGFASYIKEKDGYERLVAVRSGVKIEIEDLMNIEPFLMYINHRLESGAARRFRHAVSFGFQYSANF